MTNLRKIKYNEYIQYCKNNNINKFFTYEKYENIVNVQLLVGERNGTITNAYELLREYPSIQQIIKDYTNSLK